MIGLSIVNGITLVSGILVAAAAVMTVVLWRDEGRRSAQHTRAQTRHTALGSEGGAPTGADERESAQVSV